MHIYFFWTGALLLAVAVNLWIWNPKLPSEVTKDDGLG